MSWLGCDGVVRLDGLLGAIGLRQSEGHPRIDIRVGAIGTYVGRHERPKIRLCTIRRTRQL
ncbi:hypothetical protein YTPLAS18_27370 [Nitrospira sp.]|nr:hypothetical protein YTPLAS18_27370 [Nitrospira sp.]